MINSKDQINLVYQIVYTIVFIILIVAVYIGIQSFIQFILKLFFFKYVKVVQVYEYDDTVINRHAQNAIAIKKTNINYNQICPLPTTSRTVAN